MVDPQAIDPTALDELEHLAMHALKHFGHLDANRGQLVDVEEAAVVDFVGRDPPIAKTVRLLVEKRLESIEAGWLAAAAVEFMQGRRQGVANL